ncbi:MAG: hypothetical protein AB4911_18925 [Oscillochloridaceae bacterium umkhey_bin13]
MSETSINHRPAQPAQPAQPGAIRRPYQRPAVVSMTRLATRAGTPLNIGPLKDPLNTPNDYGL